VTDMPFVAVEAPVRMRAIMEAMRFTNRAPFIAVRDLPPASSVAPPEEMKDGSKHVYS